MTFAFLFSDVGAGEWLLLLVVVLIVMGPKRLPETARKFGQYYSRFRRAADSFKRQLMEMDTEINNAVADVQKEADAAFTVDEASAGGDPSADDGVDNYDPENPYPGYGYERDMASDYATDDPALDDGPAEDAAPDAVASAPDAPASGTGDAVAAADEPLQAEKPAKEA